MTMTEQERTMAALQEWAAPGLRARLIRAAWDAGTQNVNELAEAARVDRKTIYADLAAEGIDPKTDRSQGGAVTVSTINVYGMHGDERDEKRLNHDAVVRWRDEKGYTLEQAQGLFKEYFAAHCAAAWHNKLVPQAQKVVQTSREAERAVRRWDAAFEALGAAQTHDWAAAHHRFQVAWADAEHALQQHAAARSVLRDAAGNLNLDEDSRRVYQEAIPAAEQHPVPTAEEDCGLPVRKAQAEHERRERIAARTLRALAAAGA
ncbi:hypothetical protein [Streptomyces collinus]|uniref:hypothetical protein n=1 Tax=Streptomyces collinus TaxID=42684 RepID=UPI0036303EC7